MSKTDIQPNTKNEIETLVNQYLEICNQSIYNNKDKFLYKEMLNMADNWSIDLAIYDDEPKEAFSLKFHKNKKLEKSGQPENPKKALKVKLSYIKEVVAHPERYLKNPALLDLDWLKNRLGL